MTFRVHTLMEHTDDHESGLGFTVEYGAPTNRVRTEALRDVDSLIVTKLSNDYDRAMN